MGCMASSYGDNLHGNLAGTYCPDVHQMKIEFLLGGWYIGVLTSTISLMEISPSKKDLPTKRVG